MLSLTIREMSFEEAQKRFNIESWRLWEDKDKTPVDWFLEESETCYILKGVLSITVGEEKHILKPGMLVSFPQGLNCIWQLVEVPFAKRVIKNFEAD